MDLKIRSESPEDVIAIREVTRAAFANAPHTNHAEHLIVDALRDGGKLSLSLVAERDGSIVGHVAMSRVEISDGSRAWYGLGPVSVAPAVQGQGIGSQLVRRALDDLRAQGGAGCVVLGEPAYYARFGFRPFPGLLLPGVPAEYFMAVSFAGAAPVGMVFYDRSFDAAADDRSNASVP